MFGLFTIAMESNETNSRSLDTILIYLGITHLVLVWIPSVIFGTTALILISMLIKVKRTFQINPIIFLYSVMIVLSISGPSTYGLFSDISLIIGTPQVCKYYPSGLACNIAFKVFHMLMCSVIGLASILQFVILKYGKRLTQKATFISFAVVTALSLIIPCAVIFNEYDYIEIRGAQCVADPLTSQIHLAIIVFIGYCPSLVITIAATIATQLFLKNRVADQNKSSIVLSVLAINVFNVVQFNLFRGSAIILFYVGASLANKDDLSTYKLLTVVSRFTADLSYPITICSILMVHKSLRSLSLSCLQRRETQSRIAFGAIPVTNKQQLKNVL